MNNIGQTSRLGHATVAPEHLLSAMVAEGEGVAAAVLTNIQIDIEDLRWWLREALPPGTGDPARADAVPEPWLGSGPDATL